MTTLSHWSRRLLPAALALELLAGRPLGAQAGSRALAPNDSARAEPVRLDTAAILASARPEIDAANAAWLPALQRRDAEAIAAAYADSGLFVSPNGTVARGRAAIAKLYADRFPRMGEIRAGAVMQEGLALGGPARVYEWGHAWLEMSPATGDGAAVRRGGPYLTVWQREHDGHWRIVRNLAF